MFGLIVAFFLAGNPQLAAFDAAMREAEATPDLRYSFTMRFETESAPPVVQRFDAASQSWAVLDGDPQALPSDMRQKLRNVMKSESVPGGLLYADFRPHLKDVTFDRTDGGMAVYKFLPPEASGSEITEATERAVRARLYVDEASGYLSRYEVVALEPLSPLPMVKMAEFVLIQDFERINGDGPAVLVRLEHRAKGRRGLSKVDVDFTATFYDFAPVR